MPGIKNISVSRKSILLFVSMMLALLLVSSSCYSAQSDTPYFPVLRGKVGMEALATGMLILEDGYLRLSPSYSDDNFLIIWPKGYSLDKNGDEIRILDEEGQVVARVGDNISAAGGEVECLSVFWLKGGFLPFNCKGPYWVTSEVKTVGTSFQN
jgi:hypothetical protein